MLFNTPSSIFLVVVLLFSIYVTCLFVDYIYIYIHAKSDWSCAMISSLFGTGNGKPKTYEPCIHHSNTQATPCSECRAETSSRRGYRYKLIFCLIWPYALQALDSTMYVFSQHHDAATLYHTLTWYHQ